MLGSGFTFKVDSALKLNFQKWFMWLRMMINVPKFNFNTMEFKLFCSCKTLLVENFRNLATVVTTGGDKEEDTIIRVEKAQKRGEAVKSYHIEQKIIHLLLINC